MTGWPDLGKIEGPIVMIGFGSIGRGTLPLMQAVRKAQFTGRVEVAPII